MPTVRSDDADIAYEVTGDGDPLLLIMGFAADSRMWMLQAPAFAQSHRVITFDNRGSGGSSKPPAPYSMEQMADDARAVLDAEGIERAHVVGISMGGAIAQHLALSEPSRVRSLVLAATWCAPNAYTQRLSDLGERVLQAGGMEALISASMLWLFTPRFIIENAMFVESIEAMALALAPPIEAVRAQQEALLRHDTVERLASLDVPTLVMCGRRDTMVPPELSQQVAAAIPGAELVMTDSGHAFNIEEAETFNKLVLGFLAF